MLRRTFFKTAVAPLIATSWKKGPPSGFDAEILPMMAVGPTPGVVIGAISNGSPAWIHALGVRSAESKEPVTRDTIFQLASLTKQLTAHAAFALRAQGKLDFDKPLVHYIDDLKDPKAREVRIRHVMSHSSGFPNWRFEVNDQLKPSFEPGSKFQYSGEGFFYLQRIMEQVTGKGYGEILEEFVFKPIGMTSSAIFWKPDLGAPFALPHDRRGEQRANWDRGAKRLHDMAKSKGKPVESWKYADYEAATREIGQPPLPNWMLPNGAASAVSNAPDYAKFLAAAIKNTDIAKEQVKMRDSLGWGLGWGIERVAGRTYVWQWGDNGGYKNFVLAEPATGEGVFVFTNGDSGARVYDRILMQLTGHDHPSMFWI